MPQVNSQFSQEIPYAISQYQSLAPVTTVCSESLPKIRTFEDAAEKLYK
jgi:hypothetical protein